MAELNLEDLELDPVIPDGVPNHRASGETGEPRSRNKLFARSFGAPKADPLETVVAKPVPKLTTATKRTLQELYAGIGGMLLGFDEICGQTIIDAAPHCAETIYLAAQNNEALRRFVISLTQTSVYGALLIAHLPIIMAIAAHHTKNPTVQASALGGMMATKLMSQTTIDKLKEEMRERGEETE